MEQSAIRPYGLALRAYLAGEAEATLVMRRSDDFTARLPVRHFFRLPAQFSELEQDALASCRGWVLDIGAGTGLHAVELERRGLRVTALDVSVDATDIMVHRGLTDVRRGDVFTFNGGPFDTLLILGHGIGLVGDLHGLSRFLVHARQLTAAGGRLLIHSLDVTRTEDPVHRTYHEANRDAGRYVGAIRMRFEFRGAQGTPCDWLHVDPQTLARRASAAGWECEVLRREAAGDYLASLTTVE